MGIFKDDSISWCTYDENEMFKLLKSVSSSV